MITSTYSLNLSASSIYEAGLLAHLRFVLSKGRNSHSLPLMHLQSFWGLAISLASLYVVSARLPDGRPHGNMLRPANIPLVSLPEPVHPVTSRNGTVLPPYTMVYLFDQLIDHNNPSRGTFKQRFWHTYEFYEPGVFAQRTWQPLSILISIHF